MKIAIIGSWGEGSREWEFRGTHREFEQACYSIGREFGRLNQKIVVGGQSASTADLHVVRGIVDEVSGRPPSDPLIEVLRPRGDISSYEDYAESNPKLFEFHVPTLARWSEAHLLALREADVVLAVAGMKGTYQAGLAAIVAKKKLVPVGCFGGASAKLSASLETLGELPQRSEYRQLNGPWTPHSLELVLKLAGVGTPPKVLLIHGRGPDWLRVKDWLREKAQVLDIVVMQQEFGSGKTLPEKFENLASLVDRAIAVATPDDLGGLVGTETSGLRPRARQNVWLEIGWFWGRLGRNKVLILSRGDIEFPSDLGGLEVYPYREDPTETAEKLRAFLGMA